MCKVLGLSLGCSSLADGQRGPFSGRQSPRAGGEREDGELLKFSKVPFPVNVDFIYIPIKYSGKISSLPCGKS